ncbi:MAG TPA: cation-translocating P-type ATPase [Bacteroidales bacterium]|nr:cation-translocating P-type ATPase [Bacteroidales bacterium]HPS27617.1 cation-translocating P-type ATPase [Bacteroidales bacterium]
MKKSKETVLIVEGMNCTNCALGIKKQLEKSGLEKVDVNFTTGEVHFSYDEKEQVQSAINKINGMGYHVASGLSQKENRIRKVLSSIEVKFYFSLAFTVPLLSAMFLPFEFLHHPIFQLFLCIPVYTVGMWHFGKSAYYSLRSGVPNMDVLITLGSSAAFFYSLAGTILGLGHDYQFYETTASIITLIFFGNMLEHLSVKKTTSAVDELVKMQVLKAKVITYKNNSEQITETEVSKIRTGDVLLVNTGDKIAADGEIIWGDGIIDESVVSGESIPVSKIIGNTVVGGTVLTSGNIKVRATAIGEQSVLGQIIELVKNAQRDKPQLQTLADKISAVFVPTVIGLSLLTFVINFFVVDIDFKYALLRSIAVLVIACPCALGLAIPTAVVVGIGRVAKQGILIKGASTMQKLSSIKNIAFDKTGTLTTGKFMIKDIKTYGISQREARSLLFSIERYSTHPIAVSIVNELKDEEVIELSAIEEQKGIGIRAKDNQGNRYSAGSFRIAEKLTDESFHEVYLLKNDVLIATLDIQDEIRPQAKEAMAFLKSKQISTVLLSGDKQQKCDELAQKLGIEKIFAEKLPAEKLAIIEQLDKAGGVAMVGDGINDAPALSKATVGISLSNATQIAIQSAQIILMNGKLNLLSQAYLISKNTMTVIKQNLFWAFFYNVIALPIAAVGLLDPMIAAASMALSDVVVVMNSLRLRTKKLR